MIHELKAHGQLPHHPDVNMVKVLAFANATEGPPPTKRNQSEESKLANALERLANNLKIGVGI